MKMNLNDKNKYLFARVKKAKGVKRKIEKEFLDFSYNQDPNALYKDLSAQVHDIIKREI